MLRGDKQGVTNSVDVPSEKFLTRLPELRIRCYKVLEILEAFFSGYIIVSDLALNAAYLKLGTEVEDFLAEPEFDVLRTYYQRPIDSLLVANGGEAQLDWEYLGKQGYLNFLAHLEEVYTGVIDRIPTPIPNLPSLLLADQVLQEHRKEKEENDAWFLETARRIEAEHQAEMSIQSGEVRTKKEDDNQIVRKLEEALRTHLVTRLCAVTPRWWSERIPEDVRQLAEERKVHRESPWPWLEGGGEELVSYIDFPDYSKIITRRDNWRDAFEQTFGDSEILRTKLRELEPIRNDLAHSREITEHQRAKLRLYADELLACIRGHGP